MVYEPIYCDRRHNKKWLRELWLPKNTTGRLDTLWSSNRACVILDSDDNLVAIWKFNRYGDTVVSKGTWVADEYRKQGLAKKLWRFGIKKTQPKQINVTVCSDRGYTLVLAMSEEYPNIEFNICDETSTRKHRDLRRNKMKNRRTFRKTAREEYPVSSKIAQMLLVGKTTSEIQEQLGVTQQAVAATYTNLKRHSGFRNIIRKCDYRTTKNSRLAL